MFRRGKELKLEAYIDTDYTGSLVNRRSKSGYCNFIGSNLITWRIKKQNLAALSSARAEFRDIVHRICELLWLQIVLDDLKIK